MTKNLERLQPEPPSKTSKSAAEASWQPDPEGQARTAQINKSASQNATHLQSGTGLNSYLKPHSVIAALMVVERQAMAHNLLPEANCAPQFSTTVLAT